jgi:hypothetical protein
MPDEIFDRHMDAGPNPEVAIVLDMTGYHEKDRLPTIAHVACTKYTSAYYATA